MLEDFADVEAVLTAAIYLQFDNLKVECDRALTKMFVEGLQTSQAKSQHHTSKEYDHDDYLTALQDVTAVLELACRFKMPKCTAKVGSEIAKMARQERKEFVEEVLESNRGSKLTAEFENMLLRSLHKMKQRRVK